MKQGHCSRSAKSVATERQEEQPITITPLQNSKIFRELSKATILIYPFGAEKNIRFKKPQVVPSTVVRY